MAASGVAVRISKISSEDEEDDASLWQKCYRRRVSPRWLIRDDEALVAALKRERAMGVNER
jgi:hypothetical protein